MYTFKLDDSLSFEEGSALGIPYFTAYRALFIKYVYFINGQLDIKINSFLKEAMLNQEKLF